MAAVHICDRCGAPAGSGLWLSRAAHDDPPALQVPVPLTDEELRSLGVVTVDARFKVLAQGRPGASTRMLLLESLTPGARELVASTREGDELEVVLATRQP